MSPTAVPKLPIELPIVIAGRAFAPATDMTYEHDLYSVQLISEAGLEKLYEEINPLETADLSDTAKHLVLQAFATGKLFRLLATLLVEEGTEWSYAECDKNEEFFKKLKSREDKKALQSSIVLIIFSFIVSGVLSSRISRNYSLKPSATPLTNAPNADPFATVGVRASASASGITSSEPSPDTIPVASPSS
jgi:hypothetical protein